MTEPLEKPGAILLGGEEVTRTVYPEDLLGALEAYIEWALPPEQTLAAGKDPEKLVPTPNDKIEVIFSTWGMPRLDADLLDRMPNLKAVFYAAGSVKGFVTEESWKRGVRIFSAATVNAIPVAEFTLGRILLGLKQAETLRVRKAEDWKGSDPAKSTMRGNFRSRVGLVSYGSIARLVRRHLRHFDHEILVYDPFLDEETVKADSLVPADLETLFESCDCISVHAPLLPQTRGLVRGSHIASMRKNAVLLNTARGRVINQAEMTQVLRERTDLTVYLDVLESEPPEENDPLMTLPHVHITPHIAWGTRASRQRLLDVVVENIRAFLNGAPQNVVS